MLSRKYVQFSGPGSSWLNIFKTKSFQAKEKKGKAEEEREVKGKDKEVRIEDADSVSGESSIAVMMIVSDIKFME